jgi:hypothetical protein
MLALSETTYGGYDQPCEQCGDNGEENFSVTIDTKTNNIELNHSYGCYSHIEKTNNEALEYLRTQIDYNREINQTIELKKILNQLLAATNQKYDTPNDNIFYIEIGLKNRKWNPLGSNKCHCGETVSTNDHSQPFLYLVGTKNFTTNEEKLTVEEYCYHNYTYNTIYTQNSLNLKFLPTEILENNQPFFYNKEND